jgi:hypothetical protein
VLVYIFANFPDFGFKAVIRDVNGLMASTWLLPCLALSFFSNPRGRSLLWELVRISEVFFELILPFPRSFVVPFNQFGRFFDVASNSGTGNVVCGFGFFYKLSNAGIRTGWLRYM